MEPKKDTRIGLYVFIGIIVLETFAIVLLINY